jgi:cell division protein ZapA
MAQVTIHINGKPYVVGCEDGEEQRLKELAASLDAKVRDLGVNAGALGETRLMLMGALVLADEALELTNRAVAAESEVTRLKAELGAAEVRAAQAVEAAAKKIESLAGRQA